MKLKKILKNLLISGLLLFSTSACEEECNDECKLQQSFLYWIIYGTDGYAFRYFTPCMSPELTMQPGDEITLTAPKRYHDYETSFSSDTQVAGCSDKKWKLTVKPHSTQGRVSIVHFYRPGLDDCESENLIDISNPGEVVTLEGGPGCIPDTDQNGVAIFYGGSVPEDQFTVRFE